MIIGLSGRKQSGKNTVALIWQLLEFESTTKYKEIVGYKYINEIEFVKACIQNIEEWYPYSHYFTWNQKSFATKLKQIVCVLTGCTMAQLENGEFKNSEIPYTWTKSDKDISTYRQLLQQLGTEIFRKNIHNDIWVDLLLNSIDTKNKNYIITDVRFKNEVEAVNKACGTLIYIQGKGEALDPHQSENDIQDSRLYQYTIDNTGSIEDTIIQVKEIMGKEGVL